MASDRANARTYAHTFARTYAHSYIHTFARTFTRTHVVHTHTFIPPFMSLVTTRTLANKKILTRLKKKLTNDVPERCKQLFNILMRILRGKPLRLLRQTSERNGVEVWRKLVQLFSPKTKSRSISLLAALMNIPAFSLKGKP